MFSRTNKNCLGGIESINLFYTVVFVLIMLLSIQGIAQQKLTNKEAEDIREEAYKYYKKQQYLQALKLYQQVEKFYSKSAIVNFRMGVCYLKTSEKKKALAYLNNSARMGQRDIDYIDPNYCYGRAYHYLMDFDDAIKSYKLYLSTLETSDKKDSKEAVQIRHLIGMCESGKKLVAQKLTTVRVEHLDSTVNSKYRDISPVISLHNDTLLFASRRVNNMEGKPNKETNEYSENMYISCWKGNDWVQAVSLEGVNSNKDEAPLSFSWDGKKLYIYKTDRGGSRATWQLPYEDSTGTASKMEIKGNDGKEEGGSLSPDGKRFYFSSDRSGGHGGMDIYYMERQADNEWGEPVNMGGIINTPYDDISPFMFADGKTFYFSSEGHNSMGETDLFVAKLQNNGSWGQPQNMGYPINSPEEEPSISFTKDGKIAYFASIREDSYGLDDIYKVSFGVAPLPSATLSPKDTVKHPSKGHDHALPVADKVPHKGDVLDEKVQFANNSTVISEEAKEHIDQVVAMMKKYPGVKLIVCGYGAIGTPESNSKISEERAQATINYMVGKGIGKERLYLKAYDKEKPKTPKNRVVEFVVMMANSITAQKSSAAQPPKTNLMKD